MENIALAKDERALSILKNMMFRSGIRKRC